MEKIKGMATCKICGRDFPLIAEEHYVARNPVKSGVVPALAGEQEPQLFDAIDCPHCGCQFVMQERKRNCMSDIFNPADNEEEDDE